MSTTTVIRTEVDAAGGRARIHAHGGPLRPMLLGSDETTARVALVAEGALLLAGDHVQIEVKVGTGTALEILEPSGTVAYGMRGGTARWEVHITLQPDATLIWHGGTFVVSEGADVHRTMDVAMVETATLLLHDTLVLGRSGERPGRVRSAVRIRSDRGPVLVEDLDLGPHSQTSGVLGVNRVIESVTAVGTAPPDTDVEARMVLQHKGAVWRRLSASGHTDSLSSVWQRLLRTVGSRSQIVGA